MRTTRPVFVSDNRVYIPPEETATYSNTAPGQDLDTNEPSLPSHHINAHQDGILPHIGIPRVWVPRGRGRRAMRIMISVAILQGRLM